MKKFPDNQVDVNDPNYQLWLQRVGNWADLLSEVDVDSDDEIGCFDALVQGFLDYTSKLKSKMTFSSDSDSVAHKLK